MITIIQLTEQLEQTQGIHPVALLIILFIATCWFVIKKQDESARKYRRNDDVSKPKKK